MQFSKRALSLAVIGVVGLAPVARAQSVLVINDTAGTHYTSTSWRGQEFYLAALGVGGQDGTLSAVSLILNNTNTTPGSLNVYLYTGVPSGTSQPDSSLQIGTINYSAVGVQNLPVTLSGTPPSLVAGQDYTLVVDLTGGVTWQYAGNTSGNTGNGSYGGAYNYNAGSWAIQAGQYRDMQIVEWVPEPGSSAWMILGSVVLLVALRRRGSIRA